LAVPLEGSSEVVAVLALYRVKADGFTKDHLRILQAIESRIGFTVENSVRTQAKDGTTGTDYLTGLPNARSLFLHLDTEIARSERSGDPLALFVTDLNGFKNINDTLGHVQGNKLLQMFAALLKDSCRQYDYAARIGGDEFVVVAPGLQVHAASEMVARIEGVLKHVRQGGANPELSVSVGHSSYPADGRSAEELLSAADRRMYVMKKSRQKQSRGSELSMAASTRT
jgi:diguanylate cyclase (GGDEF)-like protein